MPRIANEGLEVAEWSRRTGEGSSTFDICQGCAVHIEGDLITYWGLDKDLYHTGEPAGTIQVDVEHPPYEESDYVCAICGNPLTVDDD